VLLPEEIHLDELLPEDIQSFYRYSGSLTTPTCNEVVTWTIFSNPKLMSSAQLEQFRTLKNDEDKPLVDNDRPVQPLGSRIVQFSGETHYWSLYPAPADKEIDYSLEDESSDDDSVVDYEQFTDNDEGFTSSYEEE